MWGRLKVPCVQFVCMSTRACHLELVDDLWMDHFIMALNRFIARRGNHKKYTAIMELTLYVGANEELLNS